MATITRDFAYAQTDSRFSGASSPVAEKPLRPPSEVAVEAEAENVLRQLVAKIHLAVTGSLGGHFALERALFSFRKVAECEMDIGDGDLVWTVGSEINIVGDADFEAKDSETGEKEVLQAAKEPIEEKKLSNSATDKKELDSVFGDGGSNAASHGKALDAAIEDKVLDKATEDKVLDAPTEDQGLDSTIKNEHSLNASSLADLNEKWASIDNMDSKATEEDGVSESALVSTDPLQAEFILQIASFVQFHEQYGRGWKLALKLNVIQRKVDENADAIQHFDVVLKDLGLVPANYLESVRSSSSF